MLTIWKLGLAAVTAACAPLAASGCAQNDGQRVSTVMTSESQAAMTPAQALTDLKNGNRRFVQDRGTNFDYVAQVRSTAAGQFPKAVVLSCLDSRVPPEIIFDQGVGDLFVGRVAGNFENVDLLGSMEFACAVAGTPLIVVLGHTACGAVKAAADSVDLGNVTEMLEELAPAVRAASNVSGAKNSNNTAFVNAIIETNVRHTMRDIPARSTIIRDLVNNGDVMIVGGVYDLETGRVNWMN